MYLELPDNRKIYYAVQGNPAGKPIVCINGLSQSTLAWTGLSEQLGQEYRMILLDLIFQGQSDKTGDTRSISTHADDVAHLLQHLKLGTVNIVGISYGSIVAQNMLIRHSQKIEKAVLLSTYAKATARAVENTKMCEHAFEKGGMALLIDVLYALSLGPEFYEAPPMPIAQLKALTVKINNGEAILKLIDALKNEPIYLEELKQVTTPTLIVHGEYDFLYPPEVAKVAAEAMPRARFECIKGVGHTLNVEAVLDVAELIKGFL